MIPMKDGQFEYDEKANSFYPIASLQEELLSTSSKYVVGYKRGDIVLGDGKTLHCSTKAQPKTKTHRSTRQPDGVCFRSALVVQQKRDDVEFAGLFWEKSIKEFLA